MVFVQNFPVTTLQQGYYWVLDERNIGSLEHSGKYLSENMTAKLMNFLQQNK